jgi:hypothetical protein
VNWVDGMRALLGKAMDCAETLDEAKTLVALEMKVFIYFIDFIVGILTHSYHVDATSGFGRIRNSEGSATTSRDPARFRFCRNT